MSSSNGWGYISYNFVCPVFILINHLDSYVKEHHKDSEKTYTTLKIVLFNLFSEEDFICFGSFWFRFRGNH